MLRVGQRRLERLGYRVTAMAAAAEALSAVTEQPQAFDLVITDYTMPEMNGIELARALQSIRPNLPIVLSSGYNPSVGAENARKLGFQGFLAKPYDLRSLAQTIEDVLTES